MSKTREYTLRGKPIAVQELLDVVAVAADQAGGLRPLDAEDVTRASPGLSRPAVEAFRDAGWVFVRATDPTPGPVAKVFVKPGGRPALATNRLSAKVADSLSEAETQALLARHGARIVGRLKFAPGLYQVEVEPPAGKDVLDIAAELTAEPAVEFAEPELLEVIAQR
ncbi:MAG TPA: hypothetical protein VKD90_20965 [Gemmataceae bacterium]|nr:hypothetical protein [Gemmataceae bacterium]